MNFLASSLGIFPKRDETARSTSASIPQVECVTEVRSIASQKLAPLVKAIDTEGFYPEEAIRAFGQAGAFEQHLPAGKSDIIDMAASIEAMSIVGEYCLSTAFCMWCQNALGWYIYNSDNAAIKAELGPQIAGGTALGGTGLSNPMKNLFGIERLKLKAERVDGGYEVTGALPWVSNLGPDHFFAIVFGVPDAGDKRVMAVVDCAGEGVKLAENDQFVALDGTRTFTIQLRKAFIADARVLADPIDDYIKRIRAGFILLQCGMAVGMVRSCIDLMTQMKTSLGHVNCHLPDQPEHFRDKLDAVEAKVAELAKTPFDDSAEYFIEVIRARLDGGELAVASAHNAMLHCGARGYVTNGTAQRRLREAYFCAIVTPATKQLRKMLADLDAA